MVEKSSASFFIQSESEVKQNKSKHNVTFDTHLKTSLRLKETTRINYKPVPPLRVKPTTLLNT